MPRFLLAIFTQSNTQNIHAAVCLILLAALAYTGMSTLTKLIATEVSFGQLLFARFAPTLLGFILVSPKLGLNFFKVKRPLPYILRSMLGAASIISYTYALMLIPLSDAVLLANTAPLFAPLMAYLVFNIKTRLSVCLSIFVGFIGVGLIINPGKFLFDVGQLAGIASGAFAALAILYVRMISKDHSVWQIIFYSFLTGTILSLFFHPFTNFPTNSRILLNFLYIALCALLYQFLMTLAYSKAPVRYISPLMYITIILSLFIDVLLFDTKIKSSAYWGTILVVGGGFTTILLGKKHLTNN